MDIFVSFPVITNGYNFITYMGVNILWTVAASLLNISMTVTHPLLGQVIYIYISKQKKKKTIIYIYTYIYISIISIWV